VRNSKGIMERTTTLSVKQHVIINRIIGMCDVRLGQLRYTKQVLLKMPGRKGKNSTRRYLKKGPPGEIIANTYSGKHILVIFDAAKLKTALEGVKNDRVTGRPGN